MIQIRDNQIDRDSEIIGTIADGVAYVTTKQPGVIMGQIRKAAGNPELTFVIGEAPTIKESSIVQIHEQDEKEAVSGQPGSGQDVPLPRDMPVLPEQPPAQAPQADVEPARPNRIYDLTGFPDYASDPRMFAKCFINNYGPDAFTEWQKTNA